MREREEEKKNFYLLTLIFISCHFNKGPCIFILYLTSTIYVARPAHTRYLSPFHLTQCPSPLEFTEYENCWGDTHALRLYSVLSTFYNGKRVPDSILDQSILLYSAPLLLFLSGVTLLFILSLTWIMKSSDFSFLLYDCH